MKKQISFLKNIMAVVLLCLTGLSIQTFAQNTEAKAQPVKKTGAATTNTGNTKTVAPWEKQPIQPTKNKPAAGAANTNAKPEQAQPIQHK